MYIDRSNVRKISHGFRLIALKETGKLQYILQFERETESYLSDKKLADRRSKNTEKE